MLLYTVPIQVWATLAFLHFKHPILPCLGILNNNNTHYLRLAASILLTKSSTLSPSRTNGS